MAWQGGGGCCWPWAWRDIDGRRWLGAVDVEMMSNQRFGNWGCGEMGSTDAESSWEGSGDRAHN